MENHRNARPLLRFLLLAAALMLAGCVRSTTFTSARDTDVTGTSTTADAGGVYADVKVADEIAIPAGPFQMGCDAGLDICQPAEVPLHTVALDAYFIDKYEVTNGRYAACVAAGACTLPHTDNSLTRTTYYSNPVYANYPVVNVDWDQAAAFCTWEGKRLPTEAEWEKAARGTRDTRTYPWGSAAQDKTLANFDSIEQDTTAVGAYPGGASPYGALDMAGNVVEWTADRFGSDYYATSPASNPTGPATGEYRLARGGSWGYSATNLSVARRFPSKPDYWSVFGGFRCARS